MDGLGFKLYVAQRGSCCSTPSRLTSGTAVAPQHHGGERGQPLRGEVREGEQQQTGSAVN